ncbi:2-dehydropantoate 2-reductase-like protein [Emericellopsis cladophorae]|uniref:2-dehydropantoate 2-reductase-like protein n=1 Tax=Emericellopsis cladophorae TaxID=2686198 RepID=A0A9P9XWK9_9HYPO|nr:2-dehydropantoate 2-reductase-like protein [Emericellopsis cladophorae]KAI6779157.1 2-dehydropantoate 2-reductase-like protein [Emericellopsis cladophorae]
MYGGKTPSVISAATMALSHSRRHYSDPRRIHILGVGNIGRLYASHLRKHAELPPITLILHRAEPLTTWTSNPGIEITRPDGRVERTAAGLDVEYWTTSPPAHGYSKEIPPVRNLLIATKASVALPEADRLRGYLDAQSTVAFAQNGMSKLWPPHGAMYTSHRYGEEHTPNFAHCITTHGVISLGDFRSRHASLADAKAGLVLPGARPAESDYLLDMITSAPGLLSRRVDRQDLWVLQLEKLVVNSIINPLTAILRQKNGVLFDDEDGILSRAMDRLLREMCAVYQSLLQHDSTTPLLASEAGDVGAARERLAERFRFENLKSMLWSVGYRVGENSSSMLQDVQAGKSTEVRDFNGWIVDMASFLGGGLDTLANQRLIGLVEDGQVLDAPALADRLLSR